MKSSTGKISALCYFDADKGRDVEILVPVLYFAEKYLQIDIEYAFIFDIDKIRRYKPDLVILANTIGSHLHHQISKYAHDNGIKVFALISEGNFRTDKTFDYWGYNTEKVFFQEYICHWSERTRDYLVGELPHYKHRMVLTGATGFDRYKIYKFDTKETFLKRYNLSQYKKVIGYAGWAFGKLHHPTGILELKGIFEENADVFIKWMLEQQSAIESILREAIENNPDILFVLKRHPNEIHPHLTQRDKNEMINLEVYPNVLYLRNEEDVHTLISAADIWTAFESTTVIEAWIMKSIPTIFINPNPDFNRDSNYNGTVIVKTFKALQNKINEYYATGKVEQMYLPEKVQARTDIIKNVIGFDDGLNHIRAGYYLEKTISTVPARNVVKVRLNYLYLLRFILMSIGRFFYIKKLFLVLPKFKKTVWIFDRLELKQLEPTKSEYYKYLDEFYEANSISKRIADNSIWKEIIH